ncbi:alpha/beta hydrolase fold protein (plasmid) [Ketogulonicigenium vulgare Y25]|uniref:Alpha/beta hydrolase fold protein n=1 Tax=Ketogulonicigenium vulgare (strain WSH-001) TaxID=759362 RepID=F9YBV4_KETVW|nr:alpha/beta hydrolase [Ketogulonicigenium vulgare]ADO44203.1 alpha/beta hydrolase fold protein [Ketogulonicigenium vulgare Y25]AEM42856.1 alpha/beta hydrolase fold protein [Ketogulonicigenium vulgare WSH-001]ALJ82716.1 alpha/beta hydrolase [Ketogulonicigenium vulgare]
MPQVTLDGCTFNYEVAGPEGAPVIFTLHGGRGAGELGNDFRTWGAALSDKFRVISYDQRGHGKTTDTLPFTFNQLADDIETLRKHFCGDAQCIVIGGSFGGFIALTYALRHPGSYSKLILRGTAPSYHMEAEAIEIMKARAHLVPSLTPAMIEKLFSNRVESDLEFRLLWLAMQPLYADDPATFDAQKAFERTRDMPVHLQAHNDLYDDDQWLAYDVRERLHEITAPTFICVGEDDWICPVSQSRLMAEKIPNATLLVVEGANHSVHAQAPDVVMPAVREFLSA